MARVYVPTPEEKAQFVESVQPLKQWYVEKFGDKWLIMLEAAIAEGRSGNRRGRREAAQLAFRLSVSGSVPRTAEPGADGRRPKPAASPAAAGFGVPHGGSPMLTRRKPGGGSQRLAATAIPSKRRLRLPGSIFPVRSVSVLTEVWPRIPRGQIDQAWSNLAAQLDAAGVSSDAIVKLTVFLTRPRGSCLLPGKPRPLSWRPGSRLHAAVRGRSCGPGNDCGDRGRLRPTRLRHSRRTSGTRCDDSRQRHSARHPRSGGRAAAALFASSRRVSRTAAESPPG